MKLKEKFAKDHTMAIIPQVIPNDIADRGVAQIAQKVINQIYAEIYLAGFEKARELAIKRLEDFYPRERASTQFWGPQQEFAKKMHEEFKSLGEEEVLGTKR